MTSRKNIIIQAPAFSSSGYGTISRSMVMNIFNSGNYNVSLVPVGWGYSSTIHPSKDVDDALIFMANNRISEGSDFVWMQIGVPHEFKRVSSTVNIGVTAGLEVEQYPSVWAQYCNQMSAIIVLSSFVKERLIKCGVSVPIYVVNPGVDTTIFNNLPNKELLSDLNFPTKFNFLTVGQWLPGGVGEDRKNIPATILTVLDAFSDNSDVGIVVKTYINNNSSPDRYIVLERMREILGSKYYGRVHIVHGNLTDSEMASLYKKCDAFVSLTHGEGYFMPLLEAVACDLPVVVTGWGGHMDFIDSNLAATIEYKFDQVPPASWMPNLLGQGQFWAYPDYEKAKNRLRKVHTGYNIARQKAEQLGKKIRENFSIQNEYKILNDVMEQIVNSSYSANLGRIIV